MSCGIWYIFLVLSYGMEWLFDHAHWVACSQSLCSDCKRSIWLLEPKLFGDQSPIFNWCDLELAKYVSLYSYKFLDWIFSAGEWRRMSLPAMLVGETVHEILLASRFAKEVVTAVHNANKTASDGPRTPETDHKKNQPHSISTHMKARRKMEKQGALQLIRSEPDPLSLQRVRSRRINFKTSPPKKQALGKENLLTANRVSPKNRPWAKKTVLFPNPLFSSSPSSQQHKFCKTRSPIIAKSQQTPHKFIIKSPPASAKFQVKIKNPTVTLSPPRQLVPRKKSPLAVTTSKLRQSFSPSRLANRLVSPLKNRISVQKSGGLISGLKQRPPSTPMRVSSRKIWFDGCSSFSIRKILMGVIEGFQSGPLIIRGSLLDIILISIDGIVFLLLCKPFFFFFFVDEFLWDIDVSISCVWVSTLVNLR